MMVLAGGIRAVLRERGPQTTAALALALDAPEDRLSALLGRLMELQEVKMLTTTSMAGRTVRYALVSELERADLARSRSHPAEPSRMMQA